MGKSKFGRCDKAFKEAHRRLERIGRVAKAVPLRRKLVFMLVIAKIFWKAAWQDTTRARIRKLTLQVERTVLGYTMG